MSSDKNGLCVLESKNEFQGVHEPPKLYVKFWVEAHCADVSICSCHLILTESMTPNTTRLPKVPPSAKLRSHHHETLVHSKTMKSEISQILYSVNSLRFYGCIILLDLASFGSVIIFPVSEVYILHGDTS